MRLFWFCSSVVPRKLDSRAVYSGQTLSQWESVSDKFGDRQSVVPVLFLLAVHGMAIHGHCPAQPVLGPRFSVGHRPPARFVVSPCLPSTAKGGGRQARGDDEGRFRDSFTRAKARV